MEEIRLMIYNGQVNEAIIQLDAFLDRHPDSDEAFYLRGNAYRKKGDFKQALNNYLSAIELNPGSPAQRAYDMMIQILDFSDPNQINP